MGKKLNIAGIENELQGASVFFPSGPSVSIPMTKTPPLEHHQPAPAPAPVPPSPAQTVTNTSTEATSDEQSTSPKDKRSDSTIARKQDSKIASTHASMLAKITKAIREVGKEVSYTRLTRDEKKQIVEIIYTFRSEGVKLSENELMRIALHVVLEDYKSNKSNSILHKMLHQ
jgi:hypothetical protein